MRAWEPVTVRPSTSSTTTPPVSRRTAAARALFRIVMPRDRNTCSMTVAASGSSCGMTRSRLDTSVTWTPIARYAEANSAPVTPEPTTTRCSGSSWRSYTWRQSRIRSPSGTAAGSTRGVPPVAIKTTDASSAYSASPPSGVTERILAEPGAPRDELDTGLGQLRRDVAGLGGREPLDAAVHHRRIDRHRVQAARAHPELLGVPIAGDNVRAGDEGLGRDAVMQYARTAGALGLHDGDFRAQLRGHQRGLVAGRATPDDHYSTHGASMSSPGAHQDPDQTRSAVFSLTAAADYRDRRASLRRVWLEPRPGPDAGLLPVLADGRHRLAGRLAVDLRRRGHPRLGGRGHHDRRVRGRPGLRGGLRRASPGREGPRRGRGRHRRCVPEDASAGGAARGRRHRLGLRAQRVRGRAAHGVVPVGAGACRGEGGRAGRLHRRPAD